MTPMQIAIGNLLYRKGMTPPDAPPEPFVKEPRNLHRPKLCSRCGETKERTEFRYLPKRQEFCPMCMKCEEGAPKVHDWARTKPKPKEGAVCKSCKSTNVTFGVLADGTKSKQCVKCLERKRAARR